MQLLHRMRPAVIGAFFVAIIFCLSLPAHASPSGYAVQPEVTQLFLSMAGVETELVALHRDDFGRALYIFNVGENDILIGFPEGGIEYGVPFLLAVNGEEFIVELPEQGNLRVIEGDASVLPTGITDFVSCLLKNIVNLVKDILDCGVNPFCLVWDILKRVFNILGCVFSFF